MSQNRLNHLRPLAANPEAYQGLSTVLVEMKQEAYFTASKLAKDSVFNDGPADDSRSKKALRFYGRAEALENLEEMLIALRK